MNSLLAPVCDPALGQIIRGEFQSDAIAGQNPNPVAAQLPGDMGQYAEGGGFVLVAGCPAIGFGFVSAFFI